MADDRNRDTDPDLSLTERASLKIFIRSVKGSIQDNGITEKIEQAAETGSRSDFEAAQNAFDNLPTEDRQVVRSTAVHKAQEVRVKVRRSKAAKVAHSPPPPEARQKQPKPAADDAPLRPLGKRLKETAWDFEAPSGEAIPLPREQTAKKPKPEKDDTPLRRLSSKPVETDPWDWQAIPRDPTQSGGRRR